MPQNKDLKRLVRAHMAFPVSVNVLKFETLFCRAAADVRLTRSRGTIASSGAWLVPAGTPGIRRRVARTAADPAEAPAL